MAAKKGYCEICENEYSNIHQHRRTKKHLENKEHKEHEENNTTTGGPDKSGDSNNSHESPETPTSKPNTDNEGESEHGNTGEDSDGTGETETGGAEEGKAALPEKKTLPKVKEDNHATVRIVDEAQEKSGKGIMDSINEMLTPEVKTALGALIAGAVALGMQKMENAGKPAEEQKNIVHDLHGQPYEW